MSRLKKFFRRFDNRWEQIRVENTNICVNECVMCPREKLTRPQGTMSYGNFVKVVNNLEVSYKCQLHFHGFGEPLLDKDLFNKIRYVKKNHRNFFTHFMTSLAIADEVACREIVDSGLDLLGVSCYGTNKEEYEKIFRRDSYQKVQDNISYLKGYIRKTGSGMQLRVSDTCLDLANFSDGRAYNKPAGDKICPFITGLRRRVLQITWEGYIIPCCFDYDATITFGNIFQNSLKEIFKSAAYREFRKAHREKNHRQYRVCNSCEKRDI